MSIKITAKFLLNCTATYVRYIEISIKNYSLTPLLNKFEKMFYPAGLNLFYLALF